MDLAQKLSISKETLEIVLPFAIFVLTFLAGISLRNIIFNRLAGWSKRTATDLDDIITNSIRYPSLAWVLMLAIYFALEISPMPENWMAVSSKVLLALAIISVTFVVANVACNLIVRYFGKLDSVIPLTSLTQNIVRVAILLIGVLILLNTLGISITPILGALGIGGLAVALALQDTLSNFFAGFYVAVARQIKIGDYIKLETGEEGYVTDISWRSTKIRALPNNLIIIPNTKLASSIVTNFHLPQKDMAVLVNVGVSYDSELIKVERVTCEVAKEVMKEVKGGVPEFEPFIRYSAFGDSSINFTVIMRGMEFTDQYLIKHEFIKQLHKRYSQEGIEIPFPIRTVYTRGEK